jgi:hypothetical protein
VTGIRLTRPWLDLNDDEVRRVPAVLGVYELGDEAGEVRLIGYAGGRTLFGLRSELGSHVGSFARFRYEITSAYLSRWQELLMVHRSDTGQLPPDQPDPGRPLGRLSPQAAARRGTGGAALDNPSLHSPARP